LRLVTTLHNAEKGKKTGGKPLSSLSVCVQKKVLLVEESVCGGRGGGKLGSPKQKGGLGMGINATKNINCYV